MTGRFLVATNNRQQLLACDDIVDMLEAIGCPFIHDIENDVRPLLAIHAHDLRCHRQALVLEILQRGNRVGNAGQRLGDGLGIDDGLSRAIGADRIHRMRRITQQDHTTKTPLRHRIAVHHRELEDRLGIADHLGNIQPGKLPGLESRQKIFYLARPVPVFALHQIGVVEMQIGDPVDQRLATVGMLLGDRIDNEFL